MYDSSAGHVSRGSKQTEVCIALVTSRVDLVQREDFIDDGLLRVEVMVLAGTDVDG